MRKLVFLVLCAAVNTGAQCAGATPPDSVIRAEITPEELAAGPSSHQMKGAILNDVRIWRELEKKLETEGYREYPRAINNASGIPTCANDQTEYEIFALRSDLADQPYRLEETAYYCRKESIYYYHYQGGPKKLNLWMGPYRIERKRAKNDDP